MTPEEIEALAKELVVELKRVALSLHESTSGILDTPMHSQDVERELRLRTAMKLKLSESMGFLDDQIADIEAVKRDLRNLRGWIVSDENRLESCMFNRLREEKRGNG